MEQSATGLSLLSHMALEISKSIQLLQTSVNAEVGSGGSHWGFFYVLLALLWKHKISFSFEDASHCFRQ